MSTDAGACANEDCTFNQNGVCVEDQNPETCRFREARPMIAGEALMAPEPSEVEPEFEKLVLSAGRRLEPGQCRPILECSVTRVVSILAPKNAGKTSLIAGVYELFLEGKPTPGSFAGSETLFDFERICHLSRAESGRTVPDMERTQRSLGLGYYHLAIRIDGRDLGLLLGDRPGETVRVAGNGAAAAAALEELRSADCVLYLMDGEQFVSLETRHLPLSTAQSVLEGILAAAHLAHRPSLALVLTKSDLVASVGQLGQFEAAVESLRTRFADRVGTIRSFETAANPTEGDEQVPRGHGINELLGFILAAERPPSVSVGGAVEPSRQFARLGRTERGST